MLIVSKNRDYYDGVVGTVGVDKSIVYNREYCEYKKDDKMFPDFIKTVRGYYSSDNNRNPLRNFSYYTVDNKKDKKYEDMSYFIVGFCGKLYVGWKLSYLVYDKYSRETKIEISYDADYVESIVRKTHFGNFTFKDSRDYILNYDAIDVFRKYNTPIFVYESSYKWDELFIVNPILNDYQFYKVFDTFQAFQEIQMFVGGVLGNCEKNIINIDDKYKIAQHGFDKWSFRKFGKNSK